MNNPYQQAFSGGYETYYDEISRLGTQPSEQLLSSAYNRLEALTIWTEKQLSNTSRDHENSRMGNKIAGLIAVIGAYNLYEGINRADWFLTSLGTLNLFFGVRAIQSNVKHAREKNEPEVQLSPETQRYMYTKFMMDSLRIRMDQ